MTQASRPQSGRAVDGYVDSGGYTSAQWARVYSALFTLDESVEGVLLHLDGLVVTSPDADEIEVASGAAMVRGKVFLNEDQTDPSNDSSVLFAPSAPASDRVDRVVLVQNNTALAYDGTPDYGSAVLEFPTDLSDYQATPSIPAYSCRLAILTGVAGGAMRDLVQDAAIEGDVWMIELARYTISPVPEISGLADYRRFAPRWDTENLEDEAVTTGKIDNGAVTTDKIEDEAVTTGKIDDEAVTASKIGRAHV